MKIVIVSGEYRPMKGGVGECVSPDSSSKKQSEY